jgi:hypothetical protein
MGRAWLQIGRAWLQIGRAWLQIGRAWLQMGRAWLQIGRAWLHKDPLGKEGKHREELTVAAWKKHCWVSFRQPIWRFLPSIWCKMVMASKGDYFQHPMSATNAWSAGRRAGVRHHLTALSASRERVESPFPSKFDVAVPTSKTI